MDDQEFLDRIRGKIEKITDTQVQIHMDADQKNQIKVEFEGSIPQVTLGSNVLQYPGFARMAIEYTVASIREKRELGLLEFHVLLARN